MKIPNAALLVVAMTLGGRSANAASCAEVSVERDATYCISGSICSGAGAAPAGLLCPKKGDVAVKDCLKYLKSYADGGKCVAPVDAQCVKLHTGAWGCAWTDATPKATPCTGIPGWEKKTTATKATPCPGIPGWEKPRPGTPCPGIPGWEKSRSSAAPGWPKTSTAPSTPCPVIPGWEKPTPAPSTPCPVIPGWEKPSPAPSTPCPVIPGWEKPTPAPSTPCPVIPGWEKPKPAPWTDKLTDVPTTTPVVLTPTPTTPQPTKAPQLTTMSPAIAASAELSAVDESVSTNDHSNSTAIVMGAVLVGAVAAIAVALSAYKKHRSSKIEGQETMGSPAIYSGTVQTPV